MKYFFISLILFLGAIHLVLAQSQVPEADHSLWHDLLQRHVTHPGWVDYEGFNNDRNKLTSYLEELAVNAPLEDDLSDQALAYWINAYNAFTIELILKHYPVESIRNIGSKIFIPKVSSPWDIRFIDLGGKTYDLNNIEHAILRKKFKDPRMHFSIVCASRSCPRLRNEAYFADNVQLFLDQDVRLFVNDSSRNIISNKKIELSKIFSWYKGDFIENGSLLKYLNQYSIVEIHPEAKITHLKYDWDLNKQ